jgi:hypothetical protein
MLYYNIYDREEFGYTTTYVYVWLCGDKLPTLDHLIEGCINNWAGYGSLLVADKFRIAFEDAKAQGFTRGDTSMLYRTARVRFCFQHYKDEHPNAGLQYCDPWVEVSNEWPRLERDYGLVRRLERAWKRYIPHSRVFGTPKELIEVLKRLRAAEITLFPCRDSEVVYVTREKLSRPRPRVEETDKGLRSMNGSM